MADEAGGTGDVVGVTGVHHVRLPVRSLERSLRWYQEVLGFEPDFPFRRGEAIWAWALKRAGDTVRLVLVEDAEAAQRCAGFPFFSLEVADRASLLRLQQGLDRHGVPHGGLQPALAGAKLPEVRDPDGHLVGFYTAGPRAHTPT